MSFTTVFVVTGLSALFANIITQIPASKPTHAGPPMTALTENNKPLRKPPFASANAHLDCLETEPDPGPWLPRSLPWSLGPTQLEPKRARGMQRIAEEWLVCGIPGI